MIRIEMAVRGVHDTEQGERLVRAITDGLSHGCKATAWTVIASLTDQHGRDKGGIRHSNEGRKL